MSHVKTCSSVLPRVTAYTHNVLDRCHDRAHSAQVSKGYQPPRRPPKGRWARWLDRHLAQRGWSVQYAFAQLREGLGYAETSRSAFRDLVVGPKEPNPEQQRFLIATFGDSPPDAEEPAFETDDLAAAIRALTAELGRWRVEREKMAAQLAELESTVDRLLERETPDGRGSEGLSRRPPRRAKGE